MICLINNSHKSLINNIFGISRIILKRYFNSNNSIYISNSINPDKHKRLLNRKNQGFTKKFDSYNNKNKIGTHQKKNSILVKEHNDKQRTIDFYKIGNFIKNNQLDECLRYLNSHSYIRLPYRIFDILLKKLLDQNRLEESWYYIKQYSYPNENYSKTIIDHLFKSKQQHFILPFSFLSSRLFSNEKLAFLGFTKMKRFLKDKYKENPNDENWWLLSESIIKAFDSNSKLKYIFINPIKNLMLKNKTDPNSNLDLDLDLDNRFKKELIHNIKTLYVWRTNNPIFNLNLNKKEWIQIANLVSPSIESVTVTTIKRYLDDDKFDKALELLNNNLIEKTDYDIAPFIKYFVEKQDLIGLLSFIEYIESSTLLRIKFSSLSEFGFTLKKTFSKYFDLTHKYHNTTAIKQSLIVIFKYLYQETSVNVTLWNRDNLEMIRLALNLSLASSDSTIDKITMVDLQEAVKLLHSVA